MQFFYRGVRFKRFMNILTTPRSPFMGRYRGVPMAFREPYQETPQVAIALQYRGRNYLMPRYSTELGQCAVAAQPSSDAPNSAPASDS